MPEPKEPLEPLAPDPWSAQIARVAGISLRVHASLLLVLIYFAATRGRVLPLILGLFACILLHELGHALTARRFGYPIRRITLYPIGGIATLEASPKPAHELWIALAGPAVNVVIVALLEIGFRLTGGSGLMQRMGGVQLPAAGGVAGGGTLTLLELANVSLVLFNLIPAFPMDGGRVLRALLALRLGERRATRVAARVGQGLAIGGGLWGLFTGHFTIVLIALFVFFSASQELQTETTQSLLDGVRVRDAMVTEFVALPPNATLDDAARALLAGAQQDFPVTLGDEVLGLLSRDRLLQGLAREGKDGYVTGIMERELTRAAPDEPLEPLLLRAETGQGARIPFLVHTPEGKLIGMVTQENVMELLLLRRIAQARTEGA